MRWIWIAILIALASCATPAVQTVCLPLKTYSPAEQQRLAAELSALPPGSALGSAMADYAAMRDADRACKR